MFLREGEVFFDGKNLAVWKIVSMKFPEERALKVLQIELLSPRSFITRSVFWLLGTAQGWYCRSLKSKLWEMVKERKPGVLGGPWSRKEADVTE